MKERLIALYLLLIPSHFLFAGTDKLFYKCQQESSQLGSSKIAMMAFVIDTKTKRLIWQLKLDIPGAEVGYSSNKLLNGFLGPFSLSPENSWSKNIDQEALWQNYLNRFKDFIVPYDNDQSGYIDETKPLYGVMIKDPLQFKKNSYIYTVDPNYYFKNSHLKLSLPDGLLSQSIETRATVDFDLDLAIRKKDIENKNESIKVQVYMQLKHDDLFIMFRNKVVGKNTSNNYFELNCTQSSEENELTSYAPVLVNSDETDNVIELNKDNFTVENINSVQESWLSLSNEKKSFIVDNHKALLAVTGSTTTAYALYKQASKVIKLTPVVGGLLTFSVGLMGVEKKPNNCMYPDLLSNLQNMMSTELVTCLNTSKDMRSEMNLLIKASGFNF